MTLDAGYFDYPHRSYGMDHDRYDWSMLTDRKPITWPNEARIALWVNVAVQYFPLNQKGRPFAPVGGMTTAYPDLRHYTLREYGNRVGIFRCLKALDRYEVNPTFAVSARVVERNPYLLSCLRERKQEIISHGWHMDAPHFGGQDVTKETDLVRRSLDVLREATRQPVKGWLSPSKSQSENTPDLLKAHGIEYMCDWINDDMPFPFRTTGGEMVAMPLSTELEDRFIIQANLHSEKEYVDQIKDAFDFLYCEAAEQGGRMLALSIHPWVMGQPHRIGCLEEVLEYIMSHDGVWSVGGQDICAAWLAAQD